MARFQTTRWSLVLETRTATAQSRDALESLCRIYRPPVLAYIRGHHHAASEAEDLTQAFFEHLLQHEAYARADPQRGHFRGFLLTALKRFLASHYAHAKAVKRGGGTSARSLDSHPDPGDGGSGDPEQAFERSYALTVIARAVTSLRGEAAAAGKLALFEHLQDYLLESPDAEDYARLAARLQLRRNTLAVAIHRMRNRLRELVREELTDTVHSAVGLDGELASLREVMGRKADALAAA